MPAPSDVPGEEAAWPAVDVGGDRSRRFVPSGNAGRETETSRGQDGVRRAIPSAVGQARKRRRSELDPVMQAAVLRLQQAIQRIENRRNRRMTGPAPAVEDPANMKRYRDW